jgi:hypothetical protein
MLYKPKYIKCTLCNTFYSCDNFFKKDINLIKNNKLIMCIKCKTNHSVFQEVLQ